MMNLRKLASAAAIVVRCVCVYAFLHGNGVFKGTFENEAIPR